MNRECEKPSPRRARRKTLPPKGRKKDFLSSELGLLQKEAVAEAQRCLGLRDCASCEICSLFCPELCITRNDQTGEVQIDLDYCKGCSICAAVCPKGAIQMVLEKEE
jgi:2-oxoacid:acceptor oxidoreductase delta subunit (pyruvate/2-ketoisovalerate family)